MACKTIGGTWGRGGFRADCLSMRYVAGADDDRRVMASISQDLQLVDSEGVSLFGLLPVSWFVSLDDRELCERLDPVESRLIFMESSVASCVETAEGELNCVSSLTLFGDFFESAESGQLWCVTALCKGIENTPFSKIKQKIWKEKQISRM